MPEPLAPLTELEEARLAELNAQVIFWGDGYVACELRDRTTDQAIEMVIDRSEQNARATAIELAIAAHRLNQESIKPGWRVRAFLEKHPIELRFVSDSCPEGMRPDSPDMPLDLVQVAYALNDVLQGRIPPLAVVAEIAATLDSAMSALEGGDTMHAASLLRSARGMLFRGTVPFRHATKANT